MVSLLDVSVLIALTDSLHEHHARATDWFAADPHRAWATCPLTENGFIRIMGHKSYPNFAGETNAARDVLASLCLLPGHQFWPHDISLRDPSALPKLPDSRHLTDCYLLALAVRKRGRFVTLDGQVDASAVRGGAKALLEIPQ